MTYKIETGIPIPDKGGGKVKSEIRLVLEKLEIGQSVLLPSPKEKKIHIQKVPNRKFAVRKVGDDHIRVWRVELEEEEDEV